MILNRVEHTACNELRRASLKPVFMPAGLVLAQPEEALVEDLACE